MTSQPGWQTIAIHILPNISQSKGNQTLKLDQLIEYIKRNIFLQKLCWKWGRDTNSRPIFIFQKSIIWGKSMRSAAYFQYISIVLNLAYIKTNCIKLYWSRGMLNFNFSEKSLRLVFPPHVYDFSRKMSCHILLTDQISLFNRYLLEISGNMCIAIVC